MKTRRNLASAAVVLGLLLSQSFAEIISKGSLSDSSPSIVYFADSGEFVFEGAGGSWTDFTLTSESGLFRHHADASASVDVRNPRELTRQFGPNRFTTFSLGVVTEPGLPESLLRSDLTAMVGCGLTCLAPATDLVFYQEATLPTPTAYSVTGEITDGLSLFPPEDQRGDWETYGVPTSGFPIPYEAHLRVKTLDDWSFVFTAFDGDRSETYAVIPATGNRAESVVTLDANALNIDYAQADGLEVSFDFSADFSSTSGSWNWFTDCPVCDLGHPLPTAMGTITAVQQVAVLPLDCNLDGNVNDVDLDCSNAAGTTADVLEALGILPGDLNANGVVGFEDFSVLSENFARRTGRYSEGDLDGDGRVRFADFLILAKHYGKGENLSAPASVPEPSSYVLLLVGIMVLRGLGRHAN